MRRVNWIDLPGLIRGQKKRRVGGIPGVSYDRSLPTGSSKCFTLILKKFFMVAVVLSCQSENEKTDRPHYVNVSFSIRNDGSVRTRLEATTAVLDRRW